MKEPRAHESTGITISRLFWSIQSLLPISTNPFKQSQVFEEGLRFLPDHFEVFVSSGWLEQLKH
jgi:hypothetical protein